MQTIIIDVENTLITQIELKHSRELKVLELTEHFKRDYIIIKKHL